MNVQQIKRQAGSIFVNLALGVAALGGVAAVTADWTAQQAALSLQQQQGQLFSRINDAVGSYMTLYYPQLTGKQAGGVDTFSADCAKLPYRAGTSLATEAVILQGQCKLTVSLSSSAGGGSYTVPNALQPTLADLKKLGLLDNGISEIPVLPSQSLVAGPDGSGAASATVATNGYVIAIAPKCKGMGSGASNCSAANKALSSSLINIQPFIESQYVQNFMPMLWAAGPDAALSGPPDPSTVVEQNKRVNPTGEFRSVQAGWTRDNPIIQNWSYSSGSDTTSYQRGADNLMLMRNGYDSAYWQMSRRDGSTPPTASWDFNGQDLTNVGKITAASGNIAGNLSVGGNQTVTGNFSTIGTGTFTGLLSALGDLLVKGATELQGTLKVVGAALFKGDVTLEKNLQVNGSAQINGALLGSSGTFTGFLTANSLQIGSTQIRPDGTLLGTNTSAGWGVTPGTACTTTYALAQATDGKLQICSVGGIWQPLITPENFVTNASAAGQACSPNGAPGRLPDGALVVCQGGQWASTAQGTVTTGSACTTEGALATGSASPSNNLILLGCKNGQWTDNVFSKPKLGYATQGDSCDMNDAMALDGRYHSLLVCQTGTWQPPGTQLLTNMQMGAACTLNGVLASDSNRTGLLVCANNVWSTLTQPQPLTAEGNSCQTLDATATTLGGINVYCIVGQSGNVWARVPGTLPLWRTDNVPVTLNRPVFFNGDWYYMYSEPGSGLNKSQTFNDIATWIYLSPIDVGLTTTYQYRTSWSLTDNTMIPHMSAWASRMPPYAAAYGYSDARLNCDTYQVQLASAYDLNTLSRYYNGRPNAWNFNFQDGSLVWTATRLDECTDWGCDVAWTGGAGNSWDHVGVDISNQHIYRRWNSDNWAVILKVRKLTSCRGDGGF